MHDVIQHCVSQLSLQARAMMTSAIRSLLPLAAAVFASAATPAQAGEVEDALRGLAQADETVHRIGYRLISSNAGKCPAQRPDIGALLQDVTQYPREIRGTAQGVLSLSGTIGFTAVAPDSPAARAGIVPGMTLIAIDGTAVPQAESNEDPGFERLLATEQALDRALADGSATLGLIDSSGNSISLPVTAQPVCDIRIRVVPDNEQDAKTDDQMIEIATGLVAQMRNDGELAAILAHELAHVVLEHFSRQSAQAGKTGIGGIFGGNGKLMRRQEEEADRLSVWLMLEAGYDPQHAVELWTHFASLQHSFLSLGVHGSRKARRERIAEEIEAARIAGLYGDE